GHDEAADRSGRGVAMFDVAHRGDCNRIQGMLVRPRWLTASALLLAVATLTAAARDPFTLDREGEQWVERTFQKLTPDEKVGQLIVPALGSNFLSSDTDSFEALSRLARDYHSAGFHGRCAALPAPSAPVR